MSTMDRYALPVEQSARRFEGATDTSFTWQYDDERDALLTLYDRGKKQGLPAKECAEAVMQSEFMKGFRTRLFTRIVPTVKDIGPWGPRVRMAHADMGVLGYAETDAAAMLANDERGGWRRNSTSSTAWRRSRRSRGANAPERKVLLCPSSGGRRI